MSERQYTEEQLAEGVKALEFCRNSAVPLSDETIAGLVYDHMTASRTPAPGNVSDWGIDSSAGRKILVYKKCSVIEDEQAELVLRLLGAPGTAGGVGARTVVEKSTCFSVIEHGFVLGNFGGPDAEKNAKAFAALGAAVSAEVDNRPLWDAIGAHAEAFLHSMGRSPNLETFKAFQAATKVLEGLIGARLPDDYVAPAAPHPAPAPKAAGADDFKGDNAALCRAIEALLALDAAKALVPHGVGGHARGLLSAAMARLSGGAK